MTALRIPTQMPLKACETVTVAVECFEGMKTSVPLPGSQEFSEVIRARLQLSRESKLQPHEKRDLRIDYYPLLRSASYLIPYAKYKTHRARR